MQYMAARKILCWKVLTDSSYLKVFINLMNHKSHQLLKTYLFPGYGAHSFPCFLKPLPKLLQITRKDVYSRSFYPYYEVF